MKNAAMRAYADQKKESVENEKIAELLPMVPKIVQRVISYLKPPLSFEDLVSAGTVGLVKAARDYNPTHQAEFKTYAYIRIRGAILDELRGLSLLPANLNKQLSNAFQLSRKIIEQTGAPPTDDELAGKLGITIDELYKIFEHSRAQHFISIDSAPDDAYPLAGFLARANASRPDKEVEQAELIDKLAQTIQELDERSRQVILLYYREQLTMKQIAEVYEISEPRVSQLHASALFNLSVKLRKWYDAE